MKTILIAVAAALVGCGASGFALCPDATGMTYGPAAADGLPSDVTCSWNCTTKDGHPVVVAWEHYERDGETFRLVDSETLAGVCVE